MWTTRVKTELTLRIEELYYEAKEIVDEHWQFHYRNNALLPPKKKARLNVWVRLRPNHRLEIYWTAFKFFKHPISGKPGVYSKYIPKGNGFRYRNNSLMIRAESWEVEKVLEVENKMAEIRAEYNCLSRALTSLKNAEKKAAERQATNLT